MAGRRSPATTPGVAAMCCADFRAHESTIDCDGRIDAGVRRRRLMHRLPAGEWRVEKQRLRWDILDAFADGRAAGRLPAHRTISIAATTTASAISTSTSAAAALERRQGISASRFYRAPNLDGLDARARRAADRREERGGRLALHGREAVQRRAMRRRRRRARSHPLAPARIGTPQLLQLSGIGPAALLHEHGIAVLHDVPASARTCRIICRSAPVFKVHGVRTLNVLAGISGARPESAWNIGCAAAVR